MCGNSSAVSVCGKERAKDEIIIIIIINYNGRVYSHHVLNKPVPSILTEPCCIFCQNLFRSGEENNALRGRKEKKRKEKKRKEKKREEKRRKEKKRKKETNKEE